MCVSFLVSNGRQAANNTGDGIRKRRRTIRLHSDEKDTLRDRSETHVQTSCGGGALLSRGESHYVVDLKTYTDRNR